VGRGWKGAAVAGGLRRCPW